MLQSEEPGLILASGSSARRTLLEAAGLVFATEAAPVDEAEVRVAAQAEGMSGAAAALLLADMKARHAGRRHPDALVIGADQILDCDGAWLAKPDGLYGAREHLKLLRGRRHILETAVVCHRGGQRIWQHVARPALTMRTFSEDFLEDYLRAEGEAILASVGAYRIEGRGIHLFAAIDGDHAAIMGLPLLPLLGFLRQHGILRE